RLTAGGAPGTDDVRPGLTCELGCHRTDYAGRTVHKNALPRLKAAVLKLEASYEADLWGQDDRGAPQHALPCARMPAIRRRALDATREAIVRRRGITCPG